jgi:hypothetical protein
MAQQTALALINGKISQIPVGDTIRGASGGSTSIPELTSDPLSPSTNYSWVLHQEYIAGSPIGMLLSLTNSVGSNTYKLSYKTISGSIVRVALT